MTTLAPAHEEEIRPARAPWHFWPVVILVTVWNTFGAFDYAMSLTQGAEYYRASGMNDALVAHYVNRPIMVFAPWTLGIGCALVGSLLLAIHRREAALSFMVSLAGSVLSLLSTVAFAGPAALGGGMLLVPVLIMLVCVGMVFYARAMTRRGVLV